MFSLMAGTPICNRLRSSCRILQNAEEKGGHVYLKSINDDVRTIFKITGFSNIFEFIP